MTSFMLTSPSVKAAAVADNKLKSTASILIQEPDLHYSFAIPKDINWSYEIDQRPNALGVLIHWTDPKSPIGIDITALDEVFEEDNVRQVAKDSIEAIANRVGSTNAITTKDLTRVVIGMLDGYSYQLTGQINDKKYDFYIFIGSLNKPPHERRPINISVSTLNGELKIHRAVIFRLLKSIKSL